MIATYPSLHYNYNQYPNDKTYTSKWCEPEPCFEPTKLPPAQSSPYCICSVCNETNTTSIYNNVIPTTKKYKVITPWTGLTDQSTASVQVSKQSRSTPGAPGGSTPGGRGVDVKHGSYARYLNRLKGRNSSSKCCK